MSLRVRTPTCLCRPPSASPMEINVEKARLVAHWRWVVKEDCCGICRMPFDACCPDCDVPGDECPPVWGKCKHAFHIHCILKWLESRQNSGRQACPMCRAPWEFK